MKKMDKRSKMIRGLNVNLTMRNAGKQNSQETQDNKNRKYVVNTINEYIGNGKNINEAINLIMKDDVIKEFNYLTEIGLNLRNVFYNWIDGNLKAKAKKEKEGFDK